jgi:hypothetical protein
MIVTANPIFTKKTLFTSSEFGNMYLIKSFPKVEALKKVKLFEVDRIVANIAIKKSPFNPGTKILSANNGKAKTGVVRFGRYARAYKPVVVVKKSKSAQNIIDIKIPYLAVFAFFAA